MTVMVLLDQCTETGFNVEKTAKTLDTTSQTPNSQQNYYPYRNGFLVSKLFRFGITGAFGLIPFRQGQFQQRPSQRRRQRTLVAIAVCQQQS
jgi:hypothetical protein